jgi:hypothetical protein
MYGRMDPDTISSIDLSFFHGAYLSQVCFAIGDFGLSFDRPAIAIRAQTFRTLINGNLNTYAFEETHHLRSFLNKDVVAARWAELGTLMITFEGGDEIHLLDDSDVYESFVIDHAGKTIAV